MGENFSFRSRRMETGSSRRLTPTVNKFFVNRKQPESSKQDYAISPLSTVHTKAQSVPSVLGSKPQPFRTR
jgi:hypothetical protein